MAVLEVFRKQISEVFVRYSMRIVFCMAACFALAAGLNGIRSTSANEGDVVVTGTMFFSGEQVAGRGARVYYPNVLFVDPATGDRHIVISKASLSGVTPLMDVAFPPDDPSSAKVLYHSRLDRLLAWSGVLVLSLVAAFSVGQTFRHRRADQQESPSPESSVTQEI